MGRQKDILQPGENLRLTGICGRAAEIYEECEMKCGCKVGGSRQ